VACRISPLQALLTALAPDRQRGTLMSMTIAIGQVGYAAGATVSGVAYSAIGFRATTLIAAASAAGMGVLVWRFLPEPELHAPAHAAPSLEASAGD